MADRPTITTVSAGAKYSTSQLNSNFQALRDAFDNLIGRDGTSGDNNTVTGDIDLNGNTIRNGVFDDLQTEVDAAAASAVAAASSATAAASSATAAATSATAAQTAETNAETAETNAETAQAACETIQSSLTLPTAVASTMLVRDAGNTTYEAKTATETRSFLGLGTAALVDTGTGSGNVPVRDANSRVLASAPLLHVIDEKAANTAGGSASAGTIHTRTLNTVRTNEISGASLSSNQITLPAGTYFCTGSAPGFKVDGHQVRIRNMTDANTTLIGSTEMSNASDAVQTRSWVIGRFTIASQKVFELQQYAQTASATSGLGRAVNSGMSEVYSELLIWKID